MILAKSHHSSLDINYISKWNIGNISNFGGIKLCFSQEKIYKNILWSGQKNTWKYCAIWQEKSIKIYDFTKKKKRIKFVCGLVGKNLYIIVFFTQITIFFYLSQKHVYWKYNAGYFSYQLDAQNVLPNS